jgi:hypothetical protein
MTGNPEEKVHLFCIWLVVISNYPFLRTHVCVYFAAIELDFHSCFAFVRESDITSVTVRFSRRDFCCTIDGTHNVNREP